ncbi:hypothetical protein AGMMS49965_14320 [Bacteroidia bacterium]|nr:hypothetical protein AGMMS49965_14320 [Bacteroidia bacterium]
MQMEKEIHIGKLIRRKLKEEERTVAWLARQMGCDRSRLYLIFKNQHIDTELLLKFAEILHHDFFAHYSSLLAENQSVTENV